MADINRRVTGKMILDSGKLAETYFERAVIFMVRHDGEGALGLILNRPTKHALGDVMKDSAEALVARAPLHLGGPVQPQMLSFLVESRGDSELHVLPWVAWARNLEEVARLASQSVSTPRILAFAGYAGWGGGQLEGEFSENCWVTAHAREAEVFEETTGDLWRDMIFRRGGIWRLVADIPRGIERN